MRFSGGSWSVPVRSLHLTEGAEAGCPDDSSLVLDDVQRLYPTEPRQRPG